MSVFVKAAEAAATKVKPHKGSLRNARKVDTSQGYYYAGTFDGHPQFHSKLGHTSMVVKDDCDIPRHRNDSYEIETLNSRYTIIPILEPR